MRKAAAALVHCEPALSAWLGQVAQLHEVQCVKCVAALQGHAHRTKLSVAVGCAELAKCVALVSDGLLVNAVQTAPLRRKCAHRS